uniref:Calcineurin-like phosphoesterase domain-containing protein n=1 Tax=Ditylum brightwellii TaxID=49249 RepID=A0A7S4R3V2_9STRA|mmetsp:Transcript_4320/g.5738  ORF Transcript_4320/g.5738 Transcript_4320/m.5738 type:complete len:441 (-) Transcript_4320:30-1352(-)
MRLNAFLSLISLSTQRSQCWSWGISKQPTRQLRHSSSLEMSTKKDDSNSFTFGVIADVQWANKEDGSNYAKTVRRCYRGAFTTLCNAIQWWKDLPTPPLFIAQLGDLIDGVNAQSNESDAALQRALAEFDKIDCDTYHLVGNHELYNFNRTQLAQAAWLKHGNAEYYSFTPHDNWRIIVLDPYQLSLMGLDANDPRRIQSVELLAKENPNVDPSGAGGDWFVGMENAGYKRRFVPYNGGFGSTQLSWLTEELADAGQCKQRVIVLSHVIVHPKACGGGTMAWDYEEALQILYDHNSQREDDEDGGGVVAVMCGHDHSGNYHCDEYNIHHITYCSPLNKGEDGNAYGLVHVSDTQLEIRGVVMDDLIPDVEDRPDVVKRDGDDVSNGVCEGIVLPFGKEGKRLEVVMKKMGIQDGEEEDVKEEEKKESEVLIGEQEVLVEE